MHTPEFVSLGFYVQGHITGAGFRAYRVQEGLGWSRLQAVLLIPKNVSLKTSKIDLANRVLMVRAMNETLRIPETAKVVFAVYRFG